MGISVVDSLSGSSMSPGATVILRSALHVDSIVVADNANPADPIIIWENQVRAGTYSIDVNKPSYRTWSQRGVVVLANSCHVVNFTQLTARMQR
jgi:hypothetical protein